MLLTQLVKLFQNFFFQKKMTTNDARSSGVLLIGLGNPGREYDDTRHNIGFEVVLAAAKKYKCTWHEKHSYFYAETTIGDTHVVFLMPQTYMNRSGEALRDFLRYQKVPSRIIAIHDDMDLSLGKIRYQKDGGAGGHRGVLSLVAHLKNEPFKLERIKIGLVTKETETFRKSAPDAFVLGKFLPEEREEVKKAVEAAVQKVEEIVRE